EQLDGRVWRFDALDLATVHVDSISMSMLNSGYAHIADRLQRSCNGATLISAPALYNCAQSWNFITVPTAWRLVEARIELSVDAASVDSLTGAETAWLALAT